VESRCRNRSIAENLAIWEEMKKGSEVGIMNALRFKMDMKVRRVRAWREIFGRVLLIMK
jgi:glutamyl/glutaminyl-tRNA synthetase